MSDEREAGHGEPGRTKRLRGVGRAAIPVAAAVGVAIVIGGGVDFVHARQTDSKPKKKPSSSNATKTANAVKGSGPRHVVGVRRSGTALVVRDIRTGKDVGLPVAAPQGQRFQRVASGGDGTYVVAAKSGRKVTFQRLLLEDNGHPKALAALPHASIAGDSTAWSDLAVAPDGNKIAYATYKGTRARLDVVSVDGRERKAWTTKAPGRLSSLSWAGETLSFVWNPVRTVNGRLTEIRHQVRTLDPAGSGGDLTLSKAVLKLPAGSRTAVLSQDGRTVLAGVAGDSKIALQAFSVQTGLPTRVLWTRKLSGGADQIADRPRLDADATGGHMLVTGSDGRFYVQGAPAVPAADLADAAW